MGNWRRNRDKWGQGKELENLPLIIGVTGAEEDEKAPVGKREL